MSEPQAVRERPLIREHGGYRIDGLRLGMNKNGKIRIVIGVGMAERIGAKMGARWQMFDAGRRLIMRPDNECGLVWRLRDSSCKSFEWITSVATLGIRRILEGKPGLEMVIEKAIKGEIIFRKPTWWIYKDEQKPPAPDSYPPPRLRLLRERAALHDA